MALEAAEALEAADDAALDAALEAAAVLPVQAGTHENLSSIQRVTAN